MPKRDMVVKEGDTLTLGDQTLKFHHPGHTPGVLTTEGIKLKDGNQTYTAIVMGGAGYRGGVEEAEQSVVTANKVARSGRAGEPADPQLGGRTAIPAAACSSARCCSRTASPAAAPFRRSGHVHGLGQADAGRRGEGRAGRKAESRT